MAERIKVHAFSVVPFEEREPLEVLLQEISEYSLEERIRTIGTIDYRIEHIREGDDGLWYIDFGKFRSGQGPGAASRDTAIRGFDFNEEEVFCEETALIYCPETRHIVVQYNHYGTRIGAIEEYLNTFLTNDIYIFEFRPKYDDDVSRRFDQRAATKKLTFAIDPRFLTNADREAGTALSQAIDIGNQSNSTRVELNISVGTERDRVLSDFIDRTAVALKLKAENDPDAVPKLQVGVLSPLDTKMEIVDLIAHRLSLTFDDLPLGEDLRIPLSDRFRALKRAYNGWRRLF